MNTRHKQTQVWSSLQENNSANVKLPPCNKLAPKSIQKLTSDLLLYYSHDHQWERRSSWSVLLTSQWCLFSKGGVGEEGKEKEDEREGGEKSNLLLHWNMGLVSKPGGPKPPPAGVQFYNTFVSVLLSKYPKHGEIPHYGYSQGPAPCCQLLWDPSLCKARAWRAKGKATTGSSLWLPHSHTPGSSPDWTHMRKV